MAVSAFEVYTGKKGDSMEHGLGATVVKNLSNDLHHTYHHLYFDNFWISCWISYVLACMGVELYELIVRGFQPN